MIHPPLTHISLKVEGGWTCHAPTLDVTARPTLQQQIRSFHVSFSIINNPSISASDLDCLVGLTQLTDLSLSERPDGDYKSHVWAAPDFTFVRVMAVFARLGTRLLKLDFRVASKWLSDHVTLEMFG